MRSLRVPASWRDFSYSHLSFSLTRARPARPCPVAVFELRVHKIPGRRTRNRDASPPRLGWSVRTLRAWMLPFNPRPQAGGAYHARVRVRRGTPPLHLLKPGALRSHSQLCAAGLAPPLALHATGAGSRARAHRAARGSVAWRGVVRRGVAWRGVAWRGVAWGGVAARTVWGGEAAFIPQGAPTCPPARRRPAASAAFGRCAATPPPRPLPRRPARAGQAQRLAVPSA